MQQTPYDVKVMEYRQRIERANALGWQHALAECDAPRPRVMRFPRPRLLGLRLAQRLTRLRMGHHAAG